MASWDRRASVFEALFTVAGHKDRLPVFGDDEALRHVRVLRHTDERRFSGSPDKSRLFDKSTQARRGARMEAPSPLTSAVANGNFKSLLTGAAEQ